MRMYLDNSTGNLCFLTFINTNTNKFEMEYEWGFMKMTTINSVTETIEDLYTEVGYFK